MREKESESLPLAAWSLKLAAWGLKLVACCLKGLELEACCLRLEALLHAGPPSLSFDTLRKILDV